MESQTKRTLLATLLCLIVMVAWFKVQAILNPPPPPTTQTAATTRPAEKADGASSEKTVRDEASAPSVAPATQPTGAYAVARADAERTLVIGDDHHGEENPYHFAAEITARGAAVSRLTLADHRAAVPKNKKDPRHNPYVLLRPIEDPATGKAFLSFATRSVTFLDDKATVDLADVPWTMRRQTDDEGESVICQTVVRQGGDDVLFLEKTYRLNKDSHHLQMSIAVENLTAARRFELGLVEGGPVGLETEDIRGDYRRVVAAVIDGNGAISIGQSAARGDVYGEPKARMPLEPGDAKTLWAALGNKYFACIVVPEPEAVTDPDARPKPPPHLQKIVARAYFESDSATDDLTFEQTYQSGDAMAPGERILLGIEAFCGPKSKGFFEDMPAARARSYEIIRAVDQSGCTFAAISRLMLGLLTLLYKLVGNYGIAIIILVIIVRTLLHPVTKMGQVNMMRAQKNMARLKPKLEALQQQYKNDRQKLQEEQLKLYREEGINPAGQVLGCLPMVLQMPIWVALWTTLNTNVDMRHQPFFGWIQDLSSPDALIPLAPDWHFSIPLLGAMMGPITAVNLLPLIMTLTMYLQQKFMQKLTRPDQPVAPRRDEHGNELPDQMAQQQKMMNFMMIFFGFIFYNFPSGLNLYILSSNIFGMTEQYFIRKHIREKDEKAEVQPAQQKAPRRKSPGLWERALKKAEEARLAQSGRGADKGRKRRPR